MWILNLRHHSLELAVSTCITIFKEGKPSLRNPERCHPWVNNQLNMFEGCETKMNIVNSEKWAHWENSGYSCAEQTAQMEFHSLLHSRTQDSLYQGNESSLITCCLKTHTKHLLNASKLMTWISVTRNLSSRRKQCQWIWRPGATVSTGSWIECWSSGCYWFPNPVSFTPIIQPISDAACLVR